MLTFTEAELQAWITPLLWPFLRALALFTSLPVLGQRIVPMRVRVALAFFITVAAQATLPEMPSVALDSPAALLLAVQQVLIGVALGFAVRIVFAAVEMAGEVIGLQMGLNFASFFDPATASQTNAAGRLFGSMVALLFIVTDGHLAVIAALVQSFHAFPVGTDVLGCLRTLQRRWGAPRCSISGCGSRCSWWACCCSSTSCSASSRAWHRRSTCSRSVSRSRCRSA